MFLPTTPEELKKLKWDRLDVILVTGDCYVDSPFIGVAVIGNVLADAGFRVGIIAQPDWHGPNDISRLGEPKLFWGITGGCMDSMVANYTAVKKKRLSDDLTAGGKNNRRPDRTVIVYANLIRRHFKNTRPLVLGGVEASLRRVAHYDYWTDTIRRSILFDARADFLVYGMAEKATLDLARAFRNGNKPQAIRGICFIASSPPSDYAELPSYEDVCADQRSFREMFDIFYRNQDPLTAKGLFQKHNDRFLVHNPPQPSLTPEELDNIYALNFTRDVHPFYKAQGKVRALETIRFSITSHRGCYGECNFCSIGLHEGRTVVSRSEKSIIAEARNLAKRPDFKGCISDVGGATANLYGIECEKKLKHGACINKRCLFPKVCDHLKPDHTRQIHLLQALTKINGVKKVFVASGIRYDVVLADKKNGLNYLRQLLKHHVSGQLKIAPEHVCANVLKLMGKPFADVLVKFHKIFENLSKTSGSKHFLTYYLMAAHPGCTEENMRELKAFTGNVLKTHPRQVQIFTPLPSTYAALWYFTQKDSHGRALFVEKDTVKKQRQKDILFNKNR